MNQVQVQTRKPWILNTVDESGESEAQQWSCRQENQNNELKSCFSSLLADGGVSEQI